MDFRDALARKLDAIRQHMKAMPPCMVVAQHDGDSLSDEALKNIVQAASTREQDSNWETSPGFSTNLPGLIQSFAAPG